MKVSVHGWTMSMRPRAAGRPAAAVRSLSATQMRKHKIVLRIAIDGETVPLKKFLLKT
jgi:hypothetical protein